LKNLSAIGRSAAIVISMKFIFLVSIASLAGLFLVSCSATNSRDQKFMTSYQGLKQESTFNDAVTYKGDATKLKDYDKIFIEEVKVYQPVKMDEKKVTQAELDRLKSLFMASLRDQFQGTRFALVSSKGKKTLSLRAAITDLDPGDPKFFATGYLPYVGGLGTVVGAVRGRNPGAGSATVETEVIDSVTREVFFAGIDRKAGNKLQLKAGLSRWGHVDAAVKDRCVELRKFLTQ
jgi:hypothetical protein